MNSVIGSRRTYILIFLIGLYNSARTLPGLDQYYKVLCFALLVVYTVIVLFFSIVSKKSVGKNSISSKKWVYLLILLHLFLLPVLLQETILLRYVSGDYVSLLLPLLFVAYCKTVTDIYQKKYVLFLVVLLTVSAFYNFITTAGFRFIPPSYLLISFVWAYMFLGSKNYLRILAALMAVVLCIIVVASGQRTSLGLFFVIGLFLVINNSDLKFRSIAIVLLYAIFSILFILFFGDKILELIGATRFGLNSGFQIDVSVFNRFYEAQGVFANILSEGNILTYLLGNGHGALWVAEYGVNDRNYIDGSLVHHIHSTPMLVLYRYGLLGIGIYLFVFYKIIKMVSGRLLFRKYRSHVETALDLTALVYLVDGLFRNAFVDVILWYSFVYCIARFAFSNGDRMRRVS